MDNWKRKELWHRRGEGFCVEVSHHTTPTYDSERLTTHASEGENRWCVYAYIYPKHPHFAKFEGDNMWQDAATALPLHGGPSLLRWHRDANGNPTSVQVGADYNHDGDSYYTHYDDADAAWSVFRDADELVAWLATHTFSLRGWIQAQLADSPARSAGSARREDRP